jgi:hypothetical protein
MLLAVSERWCGLLKPSDARWAIMFVAVGDFFEFEHSFSDIAAQNFQRRFTLYFSILILSS